MILFYKYRNWPIELKFSPRDTMNRREKSNQVFVPSTQRSGWSMVDTPQLFIGWMSE